MEETKTRGDLTLSGSGSVIGGLYDKVTISGSGKVKGDVECERLRVSGSSKFQGNIKAHGVKISGSSHIYGDLETDDMDVSGSCHIDGNVGSKEMDISGSTHIGKHLSGETIEIKGGLTVKESCAAELFKVKGSFSIGGLLNADTIDIYLYSNSQAKEIGGETIEVRRGDHGFSIGRLFGALFKSCLTTDLVEGDNIYLEYTNAKVVRGNNVRIGPGCDIDIVEYKGDYKQSNDAKVKESQKV